MEKLSELSIVCDNWASAAPGLAKNLGILDLDQIELAKKLLHEGQCHLFANWADQGVDDEKKKCFFAQVSRLNGNYPGGLSAYIQNARHLLADSKAGKNPFEGFIPSVPSGEVLTFGDDNFVMFEEAGVKEARKAAFVLVAGGLGERLGYNRIKVSLPSETTTGTCFLQHYIESVLVLQEASCKLLQETFHVEIPFVIMTSDDTHIPTLKLLESNYYFGMKPDQVILIKQEKVACLDDNDARIALDPTDKYMIQTKPHGHGDVHSLLYSSGLLNKWRDAGLRWVLFYQDTNGLLFKAIPASLGVSVTKGYHVNSLAVPRKAKEAIGGITKLTHSDGRTMVINVEYNQLDPLLRATGHADGDANGETGYSPFPGNINQLILELGPYIEELTRTHGAISEFVNPKYKDSSKTSFKSSTRLECMMQDYPKTLPSTARVGFTVMDTWLAYAPVKNNPEDAAKVPKGNPYHSATSGEMAIYRANCLILRKLYLLLERSEIFFFFLAGVKIADPATVVFNGQEVEIWPRITWKPKWALTFSDVQKKVKEGCSFSQRATMVLNGPNIYLQGLSLDGTLIIHAVNEAQVQVSGSVQNKGWVLMPADYKDKSLPEEISIRGFVIEKLEQLEIAGRENSGSSD
ncbi:UDP-sugar pyrophosphorylase [Platanthera zijinensis]|uniref:UDP-sugar pyrophosphorylase n=1 Tax=Platanthera zijinensis TaxID=2320716 RepID=A0AAP0G9X3_9ASPA